MDNLAKKIGPCYQTRLYRKLSLYEVLKYNKYQMIDEKRKPLTGENYNEINVLFYSLIFKGLNINNFFLYLSAQNNDKTIKYPKL